jgi:hypothetical protein
MRYEVLFRCFRDLSGLGVFLDLGGEVLLRSPHEDLFVFQSFMHTAKNTTTEQGDIEGGRKLE